MDNPEKEIVLPPSNTILQDGFGYTSLAGKGVPSRDKDGRDIITYTIEPGEKARRIYNLRRGVELDPQTGTMKLIVLKRDLVFMNLFDDANRIVLYEKSLKGEETEFSNKWKKDQMDKEYMENIILRQDAEIIKLQEELEQAKTNIGKYMKGQSEMFQDQMKAAGDLFRKEEKER